MCHMMLHTMQHLVLELDHVDWGQSVQWAGQPAGAGPRFKLHLQHCARCIHQPRLSSDAVRGLIIDLSATLTDHTAICQTTTSRSSPPVRLARPSHCRTCMVPIYLLSNGLNTCKVLGLECDHGHRLYALYGDDVDSDTVYHHSTLRRAVADTALSVICATTQSHRSPQCHMLSPQDF